MDSASGSAVAIPQVNIRLSHLYRAHLIKGFRFAIARHNATFLYGWAMRVLLCRSFILYMRTRCRYASCPTVLNSIRSITFVRYAFLAQFVVYLLLAVREYCSKRPLATGLNGCVRLGNSVRGLGKCLYNVVPYCFQSIPITFATWNGIFLTIRSLVLLLRSLTDLYAFICFY